MTKSEIIVIQKDIISRFANGEEVIIQDGCLNDIIIAVDTDGLYTSATVFPKFISWEDFKPVSTEVWNDYLFINV